MVAEQANLVSHHRDVIESFSIDKCGNVSSDISQSTHLQDEVRMLKIYSHRLEVEEKLQKAKKGFLETLCWCFRFLLFT